MCERIPPFKIDAPAGSAFGTLICKTEVAFYSCFHIAQLAMKKAIEMALAFHLRASDRLTFAEVQHMPSSKSVSEMIVVGGAGGYEGGIFLKTLDNPFSG